MLNIHSKADRVRLPGLLSVLVIAIILANHALAGDEVKIVSAGESGVAIKGYDTVAYFTEQRAVKGKEEFEFSWEGVRWLFSSSANRDLFAADPERFIPQYGGHCALGMAAGRVGKINPEVWKIVDGKLYFASSKAASDKFAENKAEIIKKANMEWQSVRRQN